MTDDIFKSADWAREAEEKSSPTPIEARQALYLRGLRDLGAKVYEPSTLPAFTDKELKAIALPEVRRVWNELLERYRGEWGAAPLADETAPNAPFEWLNDEDAT